MPPDVKVQNGPNKVFLKANLHKRTRSCEIDFHLLRVLHNSIEKKSFSIIQQFSVKYWFFKNIGHDKDQYFQVWSTAIHGYKQNWTYVSKSDRLLPTKIKWSLNPAIFAFNNLIAIAVCQTEIHYIYPCQIIYFTQHTTYPTLLWKSNLRIFSKALRICSL